MSNLYIIFTLYKKIKAMIKQITKQLFIILTLVLSSFMLRAQMATTLVGTGTNGFLQGTFLEVGISYCGSYGTEAVGTPAGFHPRFAGMDGIGFVADVGRDGWSAGSPDFCGDYFLPGSPVEGWGIEFDGNTYINTDRCITNDIAGTTLSTTYIGSELKNVWEGSISGMTIRQETYFPDNALFFVTKVFMTNTTAAPMNNVVYARNVDPDNDQPISGDFTTSNTVVSQPNISNCDALVTAVGLSPGCYLGLGARSQNARVGVGGFSTVGPLSDYYTSLRDTTTGHFSTADEAISIMFNWPTIAPGQTVQAAFAYILNASDLAIALESTGGALIYSDSSDITVSLRDSICPNDTLELTIASDTSYDWFWTPNYRINTTTGNTVRVYPDTTTTYTAIGINGPCGTITREITITASPLIRVNAGPDQTICQGRSATLRATNASAFTWTPASTLSPSTGPVVTASPMVNTTYIVSSNCGLDTVNINVVPNYAIQLSNDTSVCLGSSAPLSLAIIPAQPFTFDWINDATLSDSLIVNPLATPVVNTRYNIRLSSVAGCVRDTFINVNIRGVYPVVNIEGKSPICYGDSSEFYASAFNPLCTKYTQSKETYAPELGVGTNLVIVNDSSKRIPLGFRFNFFCSSYDSISVNDKGYLTFKNEVVPFGGPGFIPNTFDPNDIIAFAWSDYDPTLGGSVDYRTIGSAPNRKFVINFLNQRQAFGLPTDTAITTQIILYETSNIIEIQTLFANNLFCTQGLEDAFGTNSLVVAGRNFVNLNFRASECRRLVPTNLVGPTTYNWSPSSVVSSITKNPTTVYSSSPVTLSVTVSDNGCATTATKILRVDSSLQIYAVTADTNLCSNQLFPLFVRSYRDSITDIVTDCKKFDVFTETYALITGSGTSIDLFDPTYTFTDLDEGNSRAIPIGFNFPFYCSNFDSLYVNANGFVTFGSPYFGFSGPQFIPNPTTPNNLIAVHWDDMNLNFGGSIDYRTIGTAPNRQFIINYNDVSINFGFGAYKGQLIINEADSSIIIYHTYANGAFFTTCGVENAIGNEATSPLNRNQNFWNLFMPEGWKFKPRQDIDPARTLSYTWTPSTTLTAPNTSDPIANVNGNVSYTVEVSDGVCKDYATVNITVNPLEVTVGADTAICPEYPVQLQATGATSYSWFPIIGLSAANISNPIASAATTETYIVTGSNSSGCVSIDTITIVRDPALCPDVKYAFPNAFTPNGDGLNDAFYPVITKDVTVKEMKIFNRWGGAVHDSNLSPGWNGSFNGVAQPVGTYVYSITFTYPDINNGGQMVDKMFTGTVSLIR
jgi:gliding motility-associated-like protein